MDENDIQVIYRRGQTNIVAVIKVDDSSETADLVIGGETIYGTPVAEYLEKYEDAEVMSLKEADDLISQQLEKQYSKIVEIEEEKYTDMLEVLPPEVWMRNETFNHKDEHNGTECDYVVSGFRMIEYMEYDYTDHFYKVSGTPDGRGDWSEGPRYFAMCRKANPIVEPNADKQWVMDERATTAMGQYVQEVLDCL